MPRLIKSVLIQVQVALNMPAELGQVLPVDVTIKRCVLGAKFLSRELVNYLG